MNKPPRVIPRNLLKNSRELRKEQTSQEQLLWKYLRGRRFEDFKFRRQHSMGSYILDFYCPTAKLAIELDGGQHNLESQKKYDQARERFLAQNGIRVLRFWNIDFTKDFSLILEEIYSALKQSSDKGSPGSP